MSSEIVLDPKNMYAVKYFAKYFAVNNLKVNGQKISCQ